MTEPEKNYITPQGARKLQKELQDLRTVERSKLVETVAWAASNGDRSENGDYIYGKRRLRQIDSRIRFLLKRLEIAEIVDPSLQKSDRVVFGGIVTILNEEGEERTFQIVGVDESEAGQGRISWKSPVAKALLRCRVGDEVRIRTPKGDETVEITKIDYR